LEFSMILTIPCAVALVLIPQPILQVLFEHGAFKAADTRATADALAAFALGLPAFVLIKIFSPGYFAREDTRTPMQFAVISVVINVAGSLALYSYIGHVGIALATSLAGWTNAALLWAGLHRQGAYVADTRLRKRLPLIMLASAIMGVALWLVLLWAGPAFDQETVIAVRIGALAGLVFLGVFIFFAAAAALGAVRPSELKSYMRRA
jgi:putative peptidoglycan lipid II flippase